MIKKIFYDKEIKELFKNKYVKMLVKKELYRPMRSYLIIWK